MSDDVIAFIFARGGSKGLPGKNIRMLAGRPMIAWAITHAKAVERISRVIVSTDSEEIASVARKWGAEVPFLRPHDLALDTSPEWYAWRHALSFVQTETGRLPSVMVSVPTTAPLREPGDIEACLDLFAQGGADVVLTASESRRNPYFNMVEMKPDGTVKIVNSPSDQLNRRQDAPKVYDVATVAYVCDPKFVLSADSIFEGRVKQVVIPAERAIDIDTMFDFELAEYLMARKGTIR